MRWPFLRSASAVSFVLVAAAAAAAPPEPQQKSVWLQVAPAETEEAATLASIMLFELNSELQRHGFPVVPEQADADLAIAGFIRIQGPDIVLGARGYELRSGGPILDIEQTSSKDIGIYNQISSLTRAMLNDLQSWAGSPDTFVATARHQSMPRPGQAEKPQPAEPPVEARPPEESPPIAEIRVTLRSQDEGAEIYVGQGQRAGRIQAGTLAIDARAGAMLSVEKRKSGYHADREDFQLGNQPVEIPLRPLRRITRFGLELCYTSSQFLGLGAGFRWYLIPDYLMIRADEYTYFSAGSAFHQDVRVAIGSYLFTPPHWRVRLALAGGLGVILSVFEGSAYGDWYWEVADLWLDVNWNRWALFFRAEAKYALGAGGGLLERGLLSGYGPQYTLGWLWKW